ncbi:hypothetical protein BHM03_00001172 [Ensete ventricosum]|nr:hypothetical protein BHM03_00001172 [Ensete ventricosum]
MGTGDGFHANDGATTAAAPASAHGVPHSAWHSPVPYLFGGLAAMMGLIALALLILACSYWKLSSFLESSDGTEQSDQEKHGDASSWKDPGFAEERFFVIMAGDCTPTFLAIPIASRAVDNRTDSDENTDGENMQAEGAVVPSPISVRIQMEGEGVARHVTCTGLDGGEGVWRADAERRGRAAVVSKECLLQAVLHLLGCGKLRVAEKRSSSFNLSIGGTESGDETIICHISYDLSDDLAIGFPIDLSLLAKRNVGGLTHSDRTKQCCHLGSDINRPFFKHLRILLCSTGKLEIVARQTKSRIEQGNLSPGMGLRKPHWLP